MSEEKEQEQQESDEITHSVDWQYPVSTLPNASMVYEPSISPPLTSVEITGLLPGGKRLTRPLTLGINYDEREVIVSEPYFHIHAVGITITSATEEFKRILSEELDELIADEEELGPRLLAELNYLRDLIRTA